MKSIFYSSLVAGIAFSSFFSCSSSKDHDQHTKVLNIDFPAAFVVNGKSNTVSVINLNDSKEHAQISLNGATFPHHISFSPDKSKFAVSITSTDLSGGHAGHGGTVSGLKVLIINSKTGVIEKELILSKLAHNAVFNSSGTELWVGHSDTTQSKILIYNTADWTLKTNVLVGKGLSEVSFSNDGLWAFAANTSEGTVSMIDPVNKLVAKTLAVGLEPVGAWPGLDGNMYVDNELSKTISIINISGGIVSNTISLGFKPGYVAHHPNGELWVSDATNGRAVVYTLVGASWAETFQVTTGADAHGIAFNADGSKAFVTNQGSSSVSVVEVASHTKFQDIVVGSGPNGIVLKQ